MTIQEYINSNGVFYHITDEKNLKSILENGLLLSKCRSSSGICVLRTMNMNLVNEVIDTQLHTLDVPDDTRYAIIKLEPSRHGITAQMITRDSIDEPNSACYNYIKSDIKGIRENDIIKSDLTIGNFSGVSPEDVYQCEKIDEYWGLNSVMVK